MQLYLYGKSGVAIVYSTMETQLLQYFDTVFIELLNVRFGTVFTNPVRYLFAYTKVGIPSIEIIIIPQSTSHVSQKYAKEVC